jgi:hypothetical protein
MRVRRREKREDKNKYRIRRLIEIRFRSRESKRRLERRKRLR